jgi:hypothetical protein
MDVIGSVTDRDPANRIIVLAMGREPGPVHDLTSDLPPLIIGEHPVLGSGPDRAVPHRPLESTRTQRRVRLLEQPTQPPEVTAPVLAQRRFELGR